MVSRTAVWERHFTTWRAFKHYVKGVIEGRRDDYPDWYAPAEWDRAVNELRRTKRIRLGMRTCQGTTKNGSVCRNYAVDDSEYCQIHGGRPVPRISFPRGCVIRLPHGYDDEQPYSEQPTPNSGFWQPNGANVRGKNP